MRDQSHAGQHPVEVLPAHLHRTAGVMPRSAIAGAHLSLDIFGSY
jgi:hypothetical protein